MEAANLMEQPRIPSREASEADSTESSGSGNVFHDWWLEILACVAFGATLAALFVTLMVYYDKPSPQWPTWISLNTVVAIYTVILKTCILLVAAEGLGQLKWTWFASRKQRPLMDFVYYDDASRGPSGAFKLLWRLRARSVLASTGALITVLASLAIDPFTQQVIYYYDCTVSYSSGASRPRTNLYSIPNGEKGFFTPPGMQRAIDQGTFNPEAVPVAACATGNCTWAEYSTVGWCSVCTDLTSQLSFQNHTHKFQSHTHKGNLTQSPNGRWLNATERVYYNLTTSLGSRSLSTSMTTFRGAPPNSQPYMLMQGSIGPEFRKEIDIIVAKNTAGAVDPTTGKPFPECSHDDPPVNKSWKCLGYGAAMCRLDPCVKTYSSTVKSGQLVERQVGPGQRLSLVEWNPADAAILATPEKINSQLDTECITSDEKQELQKLGYQIKDRWLRYNFTIDIDNMLTWPYVNGSRASMDSFPESMIYKNCVYGIPWLSWIHVQSYLMEYFQGTVTGPDLLDPDLTVKSFGGPQNLQTIFNSGNVTYDQVDHAFTAIADSLTNYIRSNGHVNLSSAAIGQSTTNKTCVGVRWPWLIFPSILVGLTLVFFLFTVITTRPNPKKNRPGIWKTSPLAWFYHGLTDNDRRQPNIAEPHKARARQVEVMEILAKRTMVRWDSDNLKGRQ